ncbi:MAG: hypothetical protein ACE5JM_08510, partial [Armatimonadota bacterium]
AAFLQHVEKSSVRGTPERLAQYAQQPEDITWQASKYIRMPLVAYGLTEDAKYLDMFVERMDNLCACMTKGPAGFLGWYGLPLELFRHPDHPDRKVDVILTSFVVAGLMADFARVVQTDDALQEKYEPAVRRYLALARDQLVKKWDARGCYKDLGDGGAVYITHPDLKVTKGSLTQPHNKHSKTIKSLLSLYAATHEDEYLVKAIKLGTRFKRSLTLVDDRYRWNYWDPAGAWDVHPDERETWKHWINVEHRGGYYNLSASQAVLLYEHGLVFDKTDIDRFVKTQMTVCWNGDVNDPAWAKPDGQQTEVAYLCRSLAPFDERIYQMGYGPPAQQARLAGKDHPWQGGPVACDWLEFKYLVYPRWKDGHPSEAETVAPFLAKAENRALVERLAFEVKASGYSAPKTPGEMTPMPGA